MIHLEQDPSKYYYMGEGKMTPQDKNDFEATVVSTVEPLLYSGHPWGTTFWPL